jgi:RHS repeat-associated protein
VYDASGKLAAEYSTQSAVPATTYLFADHVGTPRAVTDQDGTIIDCSDYSPFGRLLETATRTLPCHQTPNHALQQFAGKERDAETGLDYFGARYFSAAMGRFTTPDPDGAGTYPHLPQTWNAYAYTGNNPLNRIDPDGRDWVGWFFYKLGFTTSPETGLFDGISAREFTELPGEFAKDHQKIPLVGIPTTSTEAAFAFTPVGKIAGPLAKAARLQAVVKTVEQGLAKVIARSAGKSMTVLGKVGTYEKLAERLGANKFQIPDEVWKAMSPGERWAENQKFLDEAIKRGDAIILSNFVPTIKSQTGFFRRELEYLRKKNYELGAEGYSMVPIQ